MAKNKYYCLDTTKDYIEEIIDSNDTFFFEYKGHDYYLESFKDLGWIIVEPESYFGAGAFPDKPLISYPISAMAKSPKELLSLPFLDGKTLFAQWDEIKFFNASY